MENRRVPRFRQRVRQSGDPHRRTQSWHVFRRRRIAGRLDSGRAFLSPKQSMSLAHNVVSPQIQLERNAVSWPADPKLASLTTEAVAQIARTEGIDFATTLLHQR